MPRISDGSTTQTELEKLTKTVTHLIELRYYSPSSGSEEVERITTASQDITATHDFDGDGSDETLTWTGIGVPGKESALSIESVKETSDMRAQSVQLRLDAVDQTFVSVINNNHFRGRTLKIWRVWFDAEAGTVNEIVQIWSGFQNEAYEVNETRPDADSEEPGTATITTRAVSKLARTQNAKPVLTNQDSHNNMLARAGESTGDTGFMNVSKIQDKVITWGREGQKVGGGTRDGTGGHDGGPSGGRPTPFLPER